MPEQIGVVILAAGEGKRLKLNIPKPLAPVLNKKLVDFPIGAVKNFFDKNNRSGQISLVVGHQKELLISHIENSYEDKFYFPVQEKQLGTADAVRSYFAGVENASSLKYTLILCADTPLINDEIITRLFTTLETKNLKGVAASFTEERENAYGKIVRGGQGFKIVEHKDADEEQKKIQEVNAGLYLVETDYLCRELAKIDSNNKSGEFYLTDIFKQEENVEAILFEDKDLFIGVNNLTQLEEAGKLISQKKINSLRNNGVIFVDSSSVFVESSVEIEPGTMIYPNCFLYGDSKISSDVVIESGCIIKNSQIGSETKILANSYLENSSVGETCSIGPYARLRPGTELGKKVKIGNFVETKNSHLSEGSAVSHLSYVGDAEIGKMTNIGCGFITCNYDGESKHKTVIGDHCFIGSDTQIIAPLTIGNKVFVASGSTINKDVPDESFAVARGRQETRAGLAKKFLRGKWKID